MTDPQFHEIDQLHARLSTMIDRAELGDNARELASEALEELAVVIEELQAQNAELVASRDALDDEQERYREIFEAVPDGYLITDFEGIVTEANSAACSLFGQPRPRLIGKPLARFVDVADRRAFYTHLNRIRQAGAGGHLSINLAVRDHGKVPANLRATVAEPLTDGRIDIKWLVRDRRHDIVTEALRVSEERLRAMFDTARVGIVLCDVEAEILFSNRYADAVLDRNRNDTASAGWLRTTHPEDRSGVVAMVQEVCDHSQSGSLRHRVVHRDGGVRWVDHSVAPFLEPDGNLAGFVSTLIDITSEHDAMEDLRDSRRFTAALLDTVGALVVVVDPGGRILRFNKTCESVSGFSAADVVGRSLVDTLIPIEQRNEVAEVISELMSVDTNTFENDWITADGGHRRISWTNTNLIDSDGRVTAIIGTGIDVTDSRLLESRLAQADRLSSIGRLTSGIAHDFNNTLTTLRLRLDRLSARELDKDSRGDLNAVAISIDRTQALIADLLSFSSGQLLSPTLIGINEAIREMHDVLSDLVGGKIRIELDLTADDTTVLIDPTRFEQVLVNLAINARDAMPGGGSLTITTAVETIAPHAAPSIRAPGRVAPGDFVVMSVTDTGIGIEPDHLVHIFDPYFTTKPSGYGTGLGLATTYGTVTQSGGAILVDSAPGHGSTFNVWLPVAAPGRVTPTVDSAAEIPSAMSATRLILIVDDDDHLRRALSDELNRLGHRTLVAASGAEALAELDAPIDLLLTDVQLPDMSGADVAARFSQRRPAMSIVYISGASDSRLRAVLPADAVVLRKPFTTDNLIAALEDRVDERWQAQPTLERFEP